MTVMGCETVCPLKHKCIAPPCSMAISKHPRCAAVLIIPFRSVVRENSGSVLLLLPPFAASRNRYVIVWGSKMTGAGDGNRTTQSRSRFMVHSWSNKSF